MSAAPPGLAIRLPGGANLRDLGGWPVASGGTVRRGQVFRSTDLSGLTDDGVAVLASLGVRTVYDLRTAPEREAAPDRVPSGAESVVLDVLADDPANAAAGAADLPALLADPETLTGFLAQTPFADVFADAYRGVVNLPSAIASYRSLFTGLARGEERPALFHCTTGKDRTGWASAALLSFLGVAHEDVVQEYLLTNEAILPFTQPMYDTFAAAGGDPDLLRPALGVDPAYLQTAFDTMEARFGTIEQYFAEGLGLSDEVLGALRATLVEQDAFALP